MGMQALIPDCHTPIFPSMKTKHFFFLLASLSLLACGSPHGESAHDHDHEAEGHDHESEPAHEHEGEMHDHAQEKRDGNLIGFPAAQAARLDFAVATVTPGDFSQVIATSGQIQSAQGDEANIVATAGGTVSFPGKRIIEGASVSAGETLMTVRSDDLPGDNLSARYKDVRAALEKARADYERAEDLAKDKIVSQKDLRESRLAYEQARNAFESVARNYSGSGQRIVSPIGGFLKSVSVKEGDYVTAGQPVAVVSQNRRLVLRADVSQKYFDRLRDIVSANFRTSYDNRVYDIAELNGRLVSAARAADNSQFFVPVYFEFDNRGDVVSGSLVEVYLKTAPLRDVIAVPVTALTEEQGVYYVYVQHGPDTYLKRQVRTGLTDGRRVQITEGLHAGEKVVTRGANYVKLASISHAAPAAHSHSH